MDAVRLGIPDSVVLTKEEEAELDSSMAYQHKIREQASPRSAASPAVKRGKVFLGDGGPPHVYKPKTGPVLVGKATAASAMPDAAAWMAEGYGGIQVIAIVIAIVVTIVVARS